MGPVRVPRRFSLVAFATSEVQLPEHLVSLDRGMNAFHVLVDDIDAFVAELKTKGVRVDRVYPLDDFEPVPPQPEQLEGHDSASLPARGHDAGY